MTLSVQLWARPPLVPLECGEEHRWSGFRASKAFSGLEVKKAIMLLRARWEQTLAEINLPSHKKSECFDLLRLEAPACGSLSLLLQRPTNMA